MPSSQVLRPFGAVPSVGELVPDGVDWPTAANYASGMIDAVGSAADAAGVSFDEGGDFSPPIMAQISTLKATLESTTGLHLNDLVELAKDIQALTQATSPSQIVGAVSDLIQQSLKIVTSVAEAAGAAATAAEAVGALAKGFDAMGGLLSFTAKLYEKQLAQAQACEDQARVLALARCQNEAKLDTPQATGLDGKHTPADLFRPLMYWHQAKKQGPPMNLASLYLALCGGEVRGRQLFTRARWTSFVASFQSRTGKKHISIPVATQRRMWALVSGIMSQAVDPSLQANIPPMVGDGGNSLFPILQDQCRNLYLAGQQKRGYGIDDEFLFALEAEVMKQQPYAEIVCEGSSWYEGTAPGKPGRYFGYADCSQLITPGALATPFKSNLQSFQFAVLSRFQKNGQWTIAPTTTTITAPAAMRGILTISGSALNDLVRGINNAQRAAQSSTTSAERVVADQKKALAATLAVILGGGGFLLARRYAKLHR